MIQTVFILTYFTTDSCVLGCCYYFCIAELNKMKQKTHEFLEAHQSETPSTWREEAEWRRDNWSWLRHSQRLAVKILLQMKQLGLTQNALAERMNCSQQYVSKILKGKENMSLETLTKLENALGICLILDE